MTRRSIAVFTSARADLGPLSPVIEALDVEPQAKLVVIATGTHSATRFGGSTADIRISGDSELEIVDAKIAATEPSDLAEAYGRIAAGVSRVLSEHCIDVLVLLGDRWELLAAAAAALLHGVPIAHLHGGETTEGAIDERIRNGVTKLADLHLCATADSARRIRHLGEEPWRVVVTGAPGLDRIARIQPLTSAELQSLAGPTHDGPFGVVVYHPPTIDRSDLACRARAVLRASARSLGHVLVLYPGADPGAEVVIAEIERARAEYSNVRAIRNLGDRYLGVLKSADVLIGNSSSGVIEASSLRLPVVDVGDRQQGRLRPANVLHTSEDEAEIAAAITQAVSPEFRRTLDDLTNPYGDGSSATRIVHALLDAPLDRLLQKSPVALPPEPPPLEALTIRPTATLREAAEAIGRGRSQIALAIETDGRLVGTITDGDLRRALLASVGLDSPVAPHLTTVPLVAAETDEPEQVLALMQRASVTQIPVLDAEGRLVSLHVMRSVVSQVVAERDGQASQYNQTEFHP